MDNNVPPVLKNDKFHNEFGKMIPQSYQNKLLTKDLRAAPEDQSLHNQKSKYKWI